MATVNIRRDVTDPFYRYKMEKLQSKIEGKGNGIKSVIVNLPSVANSLARPPIYVVKYFGFELGAQTNAGGDDRWIINGAHEATKLQELLDGFITKFVLCKECLNPETDLSISKDQNIIRNCKACGQRTKVDARLKLSGYILKNPPQKDKKDKKDKKEKRKAKANGEENKEASNSEEEAGKNGNGHVVPTSNLDQYNAEAGSDDEFTRGITDAAKDITGTGDGADAFTIDTSEKAMKERQKNELTSAVEKLTMGGDDDEEDDGGNGPYDQFATWFEDQAKDLGGVAKVDDIEIYKKLSELGLDRKHKTLQVLAQTLFDADVAKQINPRAGLLKKLVISERHEKAFLGGIERLVGKQFPKLISTMPNILLPIYDKEIVSEDAILKWGAKATKRYVDTATSKKVKAASEPFLTWLQQAEEDESDDDEEEDDE
ncbi:Eukaryotic translation initiation factor 5A-1 [Arthrobotrys megalospora]